MDARRRVAVWCAWSVALAAMPYFRASLEAAPMVVAPGQAEDIPVAMALLVALVWDVVWRRADEPRPAHLTRRAVTLVGIASTAALVIVEAVLCINRGIPFLGDAQIAVYETIGALEMPLSVFALTGWSIRGVSLRADLIPDESVGQGVPPAGSTSLFVAFTIGALWPCAGMLGSLVPWSSPATYSCVSGVLSAVAALLITWHMRSYWAFLPRTVTSLLIGNLAFVLVKAIDREIRWEGLGELASSPALFGGFAVLVLAFVIAAGLVSWLLTRCCPKVARPEPSVLRRPSATDVLQNRAQKSLTERELAVLERTAYGCTARAIADDLGLAEATVASYRRRGYEKLDVKGAKELRALVADVEASTGVAGERCGAPEADAASSRVALLRLRPIHVIFLLAIIVLPMIPWPEELEVAPGFWMSGVGMGRLFAFQFALVALLLGFSLHCPWGVSSESEETMGPLLSTASRLCLMALALLLGVVVFHSWCGYGGYEMSGAVFLALLVLFSVARGAYEEHQGRLGEKALARILAAVDFLSRNGAWYLCISVGVVLSQGSEAIWFETFAGLYAFRYLLVFAVCLLMLAVIARSRKKSLGGVEQISEGRTKRTIKYLEGRGLGELQAQVMFDLVSGYGVREAAERRCTTVATVKSYRQRSYDALGVHSMSELRELLSREAGFTGRRKVHPDK